MFNVFISHVHEDATVATALRAFLVRRLPACRVFLSSERTELLAGENWLLRIASELKSAHAVVLMLSSLSIERPWLHFEAGAAWLAEKVIIPVCYGGVYSAHLPQPYSNLQALDLADQYDYLVMSLARYIQIWPTPPVAARGEAMTLESAIVDYEASVQRTEDLYPETSNE